MVSRWYKIKNNIIKKRYSLYSLGIGIIFFAILYVLTKLFNVSLCLVKNIFGISCFGCGLTRGFICILELDFKKATQYNILSIPLFIGISLYMMLVFVDIIFSKDYVTLLEKILSKKYMLAVYISILIISTFLNKII